LASLSSFASRGSICRMASLELSSLHFRFGGYCSIHLFEIHLFDSEDRNGLGKLVSSKLVSRLVSRVWSHRSSCFLTSHVTVLGAKEGRVQFGGSYLLRKNSTALKFIAHCEMNFRSRFI